MRNFGISVECTYDSSFKWPMNRVDNRLSNLWRHWRHPYRWRGKRNRGDFGKGSLLRSDLISKVASVDPSEANSFSHRFAREAYASATRSTDANMHKFVVKLCTNWLPIGQRLTKYENTYDHCSLCRQHGSHSSLDEEMTKRLTAADIRREIVTGLTEWFGQSDHMLEAAAEDAEAAIRIVTDKDDTNDGDSDNDSDYNSVDVEGDAQEDMNRAITFAVVNPTARGESLFLAHTKWLTAADIRREIVTGLTEQEYSDLATKSGRSIGIATNHRSREWCPAIGLYFLFLFLRER
jgi:hypothetical protein